MKTIHYGFDLKAKEWLQEKIDVSRFDDVALIYIKENEEIIGCFGANDMHPKLDINLNIAGLPNRYWGTRGFFRAIFTYLFVQLELRRVTARVEYGNTLSRALCERLGFSVEGKMLEAAKNGDDLVIYGMLKNECKWIGN